MKLQPPNRELALDIITCSAVYWGVDLALGLPAKDIAHYWPYAFLLWTLLHVLGINKKRQERNTRKRYFRKKQRERNPRAWDFEFARAVHESRDYHLHLMLPWWARFLPKPIQTKMDGRLYLCRGRENGGPQFVPDPIASEVLHADTWEQAMASICAMEIALEMEERDQFGATS